MCAVPLPLLILIALFDSGEDFSFHRPFTYCPFPTLFWKKGELPEQYGAYPTKTQAFPKLRTSHYCQSDAEFDRPVWLRSRLAEQALLVGRSCSSRETLLARCICGAQVHARLLPFLERNGRRLGWMNRWFVPCGREHGVLSASVALIDFFK